MDKFTTVSSVAAPLPLINIDTDMIIPKQFLKTIKRSGLGKNLFDEMRYNQSGDEIDDFVLNQEKYKNTNILVAGDNFGCGSSREHAPWALLDFGIKVIISTSFADIFFNNCFKNGILPIKVNNSENDILIKQAENKNLITVDLPKQVISCGSEININFDIDPFRKKCLLEGLDDIALTLKKSEKIDDYELKLNKSRSWLMI